MQKINPAKVQMKMRSLAAFSAVILTLFNTIIFSVSGSFAQEETAESEDAKPSENLAEPSAPLAPPMDDVMGRAAVLQILNKITAGNSALTIHASETEKFGNLKIKVKDCWKSPPEDAPEAAVLMEVSEEKLGEDEEIIFYGWMFASSPGISALEHPVYDIVVLDCAPWKNK